MNTAGKNGGIVVHYKGNEFEALKIRFENQTELLYRMSLIDIQVFTGYITLQLAFGAWIAAHPSNITDTFSRAGLLAIDLALAAIAFAMLFNSYERRKEVVETVNNCNSALGYSAPGVYLEGRPLNAETKWRPWAGWYFAGVVVGAAGVAMVLLGPS